VLTGRNETYLKNAIGFAEDIALSATLLRLLPPWLRVFLAPMITIPNKLHARGFTKMMKPEIIRRQRMLSGSEKEPVENDYLSWLLARSPPGFQSSIKTLIARMLHLNFASIHTTSFIGTNSLFDLLSSFALSEATPSYIDQLLSELETLGPLDRRALQKMHLMDACLRESSRLASIIGLGVNVKVVAQDGITAPDGTHYPQGCLLSVPSWGIHNDEELYHDPTEFRPERYLSTDNSFTNTDEKPTTTDPGPPSNKNKAYLSQANNAFTSTSPTYLGFGHGRHACPGRFFAAQELKLLIAYLLQNYEMRLDDKEVDGGRVRNMWMGPNHLPPLKARVGVRRKVGA
jgi:cytochrome P450